MQETRVQSLGWEDPLKKRYRLPTSVFLPVKSHRKRSLAGYNPWGRKRAGPDLMANQQLWSLLELLLCARQYSKCSIATITCDLETTLHCSSHYSYHMREKWSILVLKMLPLRSNQHKFWVFLFSFRLYSFNHFLFFCYCPFLPILGHYHKLPTMNNSCSVGSWV